MIYQGNIPAVCCAQIREYQAVNTLNTSLHHREVRLAQVSIGIVAGEVSKLLLAEYWVLLYTVRENFFNIFSL